MHSRPRARLVAPPAADMRIAWTWWTMSIQRRPLRRGAGGSIGPMGLRGCMGRLGARFGPSCTAFDSHSPRSGRCSSSTLRRARVPTSCRLALPLTPLAAWPSSCLSNRCFDFQASSCRRVSGIPCPPGRADCGGLCSRQNSSQVRRIRRRHKWANITGKRNRMRDTSSRFPVIAVVVPTHTGAWLRRARSEQTPPVGQPFQADASRAATNSWTARTCWALWTASTRPLCHTSVTASPRQLSPWLAQGEATTDGYLATTRRI